MTKGTATKEKTDQKEVTGEQTQKEKAPRPPILIVGAGGLGIEVAETLASRRNYASGFVDDNRELDGVNIYGGLTVLGRPEDVITSNGGPVRAVIAIGSNDDRYSMVNRLSLLEDVKFMSISHLTASAPLYRKDNTLNVFGEGLIVGAGVHLTARITVGDHVHIDTGCVVCHDVVIGNFVRLNPSVTVNGGCRIGAGAYIGTGAVLRDAVTVGEGATVGMGSVVTKPVPDFAVVAGNPARVIASKIDK